MIDLTKDQIKFYAGIELDSIPNENVMAEVTHNGQTIRAYPNIFGDGGQVRVPTRESLSVHVPNAKHWVGGLVLRFVVAQAKKLAPKPIQKDVIAAVKPKLTRRQAEFFKDIDIHQFPRGLSEGEGVHNKVPVVVQSYASTNADVLVYTDISRKAKAAEYTLWGVPCTKNITPYYVVQAVAQAAGEVLADLGSKTLVGAQDLLVNTPPVQLWHVDYIGEDTLELSYEANALRYSTRVDFRADGDARILSYRWQHNTASVLFEATLPTNRDSRTTAGIHDLLTQYTQAIMAAR